MTSTAYTYTGFGEVATASDLGDTAVGTDDLCTTTTYGTNTTANLRRFLGTGPSTISNLPVPVETNWAVYDPSFPAGDFNADTTRDIIARRPSDGSLWLYNGTGTGWFDSPIMIGSTGWNSFLDIFSSGDYTGDTKPDVIASKPDGTLWRYTNTGGALAAGVQI